MPMKITSTAHRPFEKLIMDCVGPIAESRNGCKFMVTFQCDLSKYATAVATSNITAFTVAQAFVEHVVCKHGLPEVLLSDNGTNFVSSMFQEVCKTLKITHITATVAHPATVGAVERYHKTLATYLRIYTDKEKDSWDEWLPYALFVYNTTKHNSTKYTPHFLVYGFDVEIPSNLKVNPNPIYNYENYASILRNRLKTAHELAKQNILASKEHNKKYYDRKKHPENFSVGDMVLVLNENKNHKFEELYLGPFEVLEVPSEENCLIKMGRKSKLLHKNKLKMAEKYEIDPMQ